MSPPHPERRIQDLDAARALFAPIAAAAQEIGVFTYVDPKRIILGMRHMVGVVDRIVPQVRTIAADAIAFEAAGVVMAHNHPSGDPTPSAADLDFTRILARALDALGVRLIDHLILARSETISLRALGKL